MLAVDDWPLWLLQLLFAASVVLTMLEQLPTSPPFLSWDTNLLGDTERAATMGTTTWSPPLLLASSSISLPWLYLPCKGGEYWGRVAVNKCPFYNSQEIY